MADDEVTIDWAQASVGKARLRVDDAAAGSESDLRHLLEAAVVQANANVRDDTDDDDETDASGERSEGDQTMTDAFRGFA
jgi:hypothetical protein